MNKTRLLIRRGENSALVDNEEMIAYGQPVYNATKNYLSVGEKTQKKYKALKPLSAMRLYGYFDDLDTIKKTNANSIFGVYATNDEFLIEVTGDSKSVKVKNKATSLILLDHLSQTILPGTLKVSEIATMTNSDLTIKNTENNEGKLEINRKINSSLDKIEFLKPLQIGDTEIASSKITASSILSTVATLGSATIAGTLGVIGDASFKKGEFESVLSDKVETQFVTIGNSNIVVKNGSNQVVFQVDTDGNIQIKGDLKVTGKITTAKLDIGVEE